MDLDGILDRHDTGSGTFDRAAVRSIVAELLTEMGGSIRAGSSPSLAARKPRAAASAAAAAPAATQPRPEARRASVALRQPRASRLAQVGSARSARSDAATAAPAAVDDDDSPRRRPMPVPSPVWRGANHISVVQLDTVSSKDPRDNSSFILYGFDVRIFGRSIHHIRTRYSKARHFHDVIDSEGLLKHFKPSLDFPGRHVFWDNVKDPDSITTRWEEMRCYYERLLNQPEALACPLLYDELGLSEATLLNACLQTPSSTPSSPKNGARRSRQPASKGADDVLGSAPAADKEGPEGSHGTSSCPEGGGEEGERGGEE